MAFKTKLHKLGYFMMINAIIAMLIACRFFFYIPEIPTDILGFSFLVSSIFSHMTMLALLVTVVSIPLLFLPSTIRKILISGLASFALILLFLDTIVYSQYRFHINAVMFELVTSGQIVSFSFMTWLMAVVAVLFVWIIEYYFIHKLENNIPFKSKNLGKKFTLLTIFTLLISNGIHVWAAANVYQPVTMTKRYLPLFYPATSTKTMKKYGWINEEAIEKQKLMSLENKSDLNYPVQKLNTNPINKPINIMWIVVDSWRADTFNSENTPNMWAYAQKGQIFNKHYSTGNCTRTGVFGMFYAIPGTYWHGVLVNRQSPVFMDRLQQLDYQLGIFAAAKLTNPEFDQTIFSKVPNLRISSEGSSPAGLDVGLTEDWLKWFDKRNKSKPTFSFLFYDAPHGYDFPKDYPHRFEPMLKEVNYLKLNNETDRTLMMNRYKTSVHYVDSLVKNVLDKLQASGEADNTLVIITGDHGQEVNDNLQNFWGHNGNYTDAQTLVPFAMIGPSVDPTKQWDQNTITSHQDIVPTLMQNYLGVRNNISDYAVGENLLGPEKQRDWILASNYSSYAVITKNNILEVGAVGQYELFDKTNRPIKNQQLNGAYLQAALEQISRFNK